MENTPPDNDEPTTPPPAGLLGLDPCGLLGLAMVPPPAGESPPLNTPSLEWSPPSSRDLAAWLEGYEVVGYLGRGGMGAVYKVRQPGLDRIVALKLLPEEISADEAFATRFRQEARVLAGLRHPNIVVVHEFGQTSRGHLFFTMEWVDGETLARVLERGKMEPDLALNLIRQTAAALEHAHQAGIIHRDVKPENILIPKDGSGVKVVDFGLAQLQQRRGWRQLTREGTAVGTPDYAAPEQLVPGTPVDHRADIFSLGMVAYEAFTGLRPRGNLSPPSEHADVPALLNPVLMRALEHDPAARYQTVADFSTALARAFDVASPGGSTTPAEESWNDLLALLEEGRVVPIIGTEILTAKINGREVNLLLEHASQLAGLLGVNVSGLPAGFGINHVAASYLSSGRPAYRLYAELHRLLADPDLPLPEPLLALARMEPLCLFLSTTPDRLMERALQQVRGAEPLSISFSRLNPTPADLPATRDSASGTDTVYHLFGLSKPVEGAFAVTDEDTIEYFQSLRGDSRPDRLFSTLQQSHLLMLGTGFPDWLTRFFLREIRGRAFTSNTQFGEAIAERRAIVDPEMQFFFRHSSPRTHILPRGEPGAVILELEQRWRARRPLRTGVSVDIPPDAVCLSGAAEDLPAVRRLAEALEGSGVPVWFDRTLLAGDIQRDSRLQRHVRNCPLFVPVISAETQDRIEGPFRQEWKWASERAAVQGAEFIVPVVLGTVTPEDALAPEPFRTVPWSALPESTPTNEFVRHLRDRFRQFRRQQKS